MTGILETQVLIPFADEDQPGLGGNRLTLELDRTFGTFGLGSRRLRLYPSVNPLLRASIGTATKGPSRVDDIGPESVLFSGGTTASTRRPIINLATLETFGATFDREGNSINPSFSVVNGQLTASEPTFGSVVLNYQTTWRQINYTGEDTSGGQGLSFDLGTVLCFFNGSVAQLTITPTDFVEDLGDTLYEVTSEAIANQDGLFEKPPGWTGSPGSPTFDEGAPDGAFPNELHERVHETGYLTPQGSVFTRRQRVKAAKPFESTGFSPVLSLQVATPSDQGLTAEQIGSGQAQAAIQSARERYGV